MTFSSSIHKQCLFVLVILMSVFAAEPAAAQPGTVIGLGGKCLDVFQSGTADGTPLVLFRCTGTPNQTFTFEQVGSQVRVRTIGNKCIQPMMPGPGAPPTDVEIGLCENAAALWNVSGWFPEYFALISAGGGSCLDVLGASTDDLTPIVTLSLYWQRQSAVGLSAAADRRTVGGAGRRSDRHRRQMPRRARLGY